MSSLVYATGHIKDPVPLIEKSRASCPGGRVSPSFIHQVIIITGLNTLYDCIYVLALRMAEGVEPPPQTSTYLQWLLGVKISQMTVKEAFRL